METVRSLAGAVEERHPIVSRLHVLAGQCLVRIDTNSLALRDLLSDYFRQWVVSPGEPNVVVTALESDDRTLDVPFTDWERDAGKQGKKDEFSDLPDGRAVRKARTGMQYLLGAGHRVVFGRAAKNYNQVVNFVDAQVINWLMGRGQVLCHAAGVVRGERGLAIAGISGAGKSTLSLRLVAAGLDFTSNDRLLVGRDTAGHAMNGVPKQPRVNPGTVLSIAELRPVLPPERREALESLGTDQLWELEEKYDADIGRLFGDGRFRLSAPLSAFLVLTWNRKNTAAARFSRVDLSTRKDVLAAIMKSPGPFYEEARGQGGPSGVRRVVPSEYLEAFDGLPVYEATGKVDFEAAVAFSIDLLSKEGGGS